MKVLKLVNGEQPVGDAKRLLLDELHREVKAPFKTRVRGKYVVMTTNQKVHLNFGRLSETAQLIFCQLIEEAFGDENELMITDEYLRPDGPHIFATSASRIKGPEGFVFHLSLGH